MIQSAIENIIKPGMFKSQLRMKFGEVELIHSKFSRFNMEKIINDGDENEYLHHCLEMLCNKLDRL